MSGWGIGNSCVCVKFGQLEILNYDSPTSKESALQSETEKYKIRLPQENEWATNWQIINQLECVKFLDN